MNNKLKEGERLYAEGNLEEAEKSFLSILEKDDNNKEAFNNLGVIAFEKDDIVKAVDYFTSSLEIDHFYREAIVNYTNMLRSMNQLHIARPLLEKVADNYPGDNEIAQILEEIYPSPQSMLKIAILCLPGYESFLGDIVHHLENRYEVRTCYTEDEQVIESAVEWADIVWLEWANGMAAHVTHRIPSISQKKVICRIHSYEVLDECLPHIEWSKINIAIFVAGHIKTIAYELYPSIAEKTKSIVVKNGVDENKFPFSNQKHGFNIAVSGNINSKKNPAMWVEIMSRLVKINPQYMLKVAGDVQEPRFKYYFENIIRKSGLEKNIEFFGRVNDIPGWFKKEEINYLLSTSIFESFGYGIAEAMAMGYKPLIYNFPHAGNIWPHNCIFNSIDELIEILKSNVDYDSQKYREFIKSGYSLSSQMKEIDSILAEFINKSSTQVNSGIPREIELYKNLL